MARSGIGRTMLGPWCSTEPPMNPPRLARALLTSPIRTAAGSMAMSTSRHRSSSTRCNSAVSTAPASSGGLLTTIRPRRGSYSPGRRLGSFGSW